jgi:hypothetical protein
LDFTAQDDKERYALVPSVDEHLSGRRRTPSTVRGDPRDLLGREPRKKTLG